MWAINDLPVGNILKMENVVSGQNNSWIETKACKIPQRSAGLKDLIFVAFCSAFHFLI